MGTRQTVRKTPERIILLFGVIKGLLRKILDRADEVFQKIYRKEMHGGKRPHFSLKNISEIGVEQAIAWANQFPKTDERMRETIFGQIGARVGKAGYRRQQPDG